MPTEDQSVASQTAILAELDLVVGMYKHVVDVFMKGSLLFVGLFGALIAYAFDDRASHQLRIAIFLLSLLVSGGSYLAGLAGKRAVQELQDVADKLADRLIGLERVPFTLALRGVVAMLVIPVTLGACSILGLWLVAIGAFGGL